MRKRRERKREEAPDQHPATDLSLATTTSSQVHEASVCVSFRFCVCLRVPRVCARACVCVCLPLCFKSQAPPLVSSLSGCARPLDPFPSCLASSLPCQTQQRKLSSFPTAEFQAAEMFPCSSCPLLSVPRNPADVLHSPHYQQRKHHWWPMRIRETPLCCFLTLALTCNTLLDL